MRSNSLKPVSSSAPFRWIPCAIRSERVTAPERNLGRIWLLACLAMSLFCANEALCLVADDVPVSAPHLTSLNPCFRTKSTSIKLIDGTKQPALELVCGGIATWDIPQGVSSFHVTLWRAETANAISNSQPPPNNPDSLRVLISLDGKPAADTVLHDSTPAETWTIPTNHAHTISIELEQEYGAFGLYLGDPAFSSQPVHSATVRQMLNQGEAYVNLGSGPRQAAFFDFHPGESVPIQAEFAGNAPFADVQVRISSIQGMGAHTVPVRIPLHAEGSYSVGESHWQVPQMYGPADVQILASFNGHQAFSSSAQIALAKAPDPATVSAASVFGVNNNTQGSPFLDDDEISLWGVKWTRFFLNWGVIESTPGQYDWHYIDPLVQSYSAQHLELIGVFGELPPKWLTDPDQMRPAFLRFVNAALEHFKGKIKVWGPYNEINSKFYSHDKGFNREAEPNGDILVLRQELQQIKGFDPSLIKVCCAAGNTDFMPYEKRLYDAGLLQWTDKAELHSYQEGPPEESDSGMTYVEMVERLRQLTGMYGPPKQVWVTESNWLFGPAGGSNVFAPQVTEHEQSQYLVRGALLSLGIHTPYFIHHPFFFVTHHSILVDSLASYAELTYLLSNGRDAHLLNLPQHVFGVTASTSAGTVVALWTDSQKSVAVHFSGLENYSIQDMYGNPLPPSELLQLSGSPLYVIGRGTPSVTPISVSAPAQKMLPPVSTWKVASDARERVESNGQVHITSSPSKYYRQITSPVINVSPDHCYVISFPLVMHQGGIDAQIIDPNANKGIRNEYVYAFSGSDQYHPTYRFKTTGTSQIQVAVTDSNPIEPAVSDFEIGNVTLSDCP